MTMELSSQPKRIVLFGDQTESVLPAIQTLYKRAPSSIYIRHFLGVSIDAARHSLVEFCSGSGKAVFHFDSFLSLAEESAKRSCPDVVVQTLLLCVAQLGHLVLNLEDDPECLLNSLAAGWCTGLLPAAVAACSHSLVQVLELSPETISLAVRLGIESYKRAQAIETSESSWARVVSGLTEKEVDDVLTQFNSTFNILPLKAAYISALTSTSCTISGPPSTLDHLFSCEAFQNRGRQQPTIPLQISAPFHAEHLPGVAYTDATASHSSLNIRIPLLSSSLGDKMHGQTFRDLIPQIIDDVFQNKIQESKLLEACRKSLDDAHPTQLLPIIAAGLHRRLESHIGASGSNLPKPFSPFNTTQPCTRDTPSSSEGVAIVGMSGRFPGADSLEEFWTVLENGVDLCRQIPSDRFDVRAHNEGASEMSATAPYGCFIDKPGMFDARLFNMSPREAASTDPGQRLLLMSTYEALEMAGYTQAPREEERDAKVGTFFGQTIDDWKEYNAAENVDMYYVTGGIRAFSAGRVNYHFKWDGPSYSVDSACSSSLLAIQLACNSLRSGESNMAVAGGSNILTGCNMYDGLSRGSFLSKTGSCKTFDITADGYCRGEGVGVVVLKRLSDAVANRDPILAVIRSSATNHSAKAVSITHPHVETQERLYRDVLSQAGFEPAEVDYVECHGTGTQAGDGAESMSVYNSLCKTPRPQPLVIGSIKPNVGHGEAAAGVSSLIKSIMMLQHDMFLPHVGIKGEINPKLPPFADKYRIAKLAPFLRQQGKTRKLMVNNFSAAGGNTSIVVEDAPLTARDNLVDGGVDLRTSHVVTVSAKTPASLRGNLERLRDFMLASTPSVSLADIAYTTTARRLHHPVRKAFTAKSVEELANKLEKDCAELNESGSAANSQKPPSVVFAFPGQGSSIVGTAKVLYNSSPLFQRILGELDSLCAAQGLPSILPPLLGVSSASDPSPLENQLCMALLEVAMVRLWRSWGVEPSLVIGHSLGEYAALYTAGVISAADVVFLVAKRASLMQEMCSRGTHKMLSLRMSADDARVALETAGLASLEITCINGPTATVVAGLEADLQLFMQQQKAAGVTAVFLDVPYAFHSAQLDPILDAYESSTAAVNFVKPRIPIASSRLGSVVEQDGVFNSSYLARQAREPVLFARAVTASQEAHKVDQNTLWLEMGPGSTCVSLVRQSLGTAPALTLSTLDNKKGIWEGISTTLAALYSRGINVNWVEFHRDYKHSLSVVSLPHYAFDLKNYWLEYTSRKDRVTSPVEAPKPAPKFFSSCWQEIEEENFGTSEASVKFLSDLNRPELAGMVHGHAVGGISLCPSSVYASMAFSCALYIFQRRDSALAADEVPPMDLSDMEIFSPCVVSTDVDQPQVLLVTATQHSPTSPVELIFSTSYDDEETYRQNARCVVHLTSKAAAFSEANKNLYLIQDRAEMLRRKEPEGDVHKLKKKMVYKLFKTVVDYSPRYFGMEDLLLSSDRPESCARLSFDTPAEPENFVHNPFWIDCLAQLGGFSLNVNPPSGQDDVYISHGWQSMRILRRLSDQEDYACYVCMQPSETQPGVWSGDVYVYSGNTVVALCMGLKFKQMRRPLLYNLLGHALPSKLSPSAPPTPPIHSRSPSATPPLSRVNTARSIGTTPFPVLETHKPHVSFADVLGVITESAGLETSDVSDLSTEWSNLGIDSLLTITILEQLRKLTSLDLASSLFTQSPTVGDLKVYFQSHLEVRSPVESEVTRPLRPRDTSCSSKARSRSFLPAAVSRLRTSTSVSSSSRSSEADSAIDVGSRSSGSSDSAELLMSIISREVGISRAEISPWTKFAELGLDSLLTITVLAMFREESGISLPSSFFNEHPTPNDVDATLNSAKESPLTSVASEDFGDSPEPAKDVAQLNRSQGREPGESRYESKPILIQGTPRPDGQALFLLPDGSGSALSYINMPPVTTTTSLAVYALSSPFISDPDSYDISLPDVAAIMLRTVRNLQPSGPYLIAGWSMGGILAYEAARQLLAAGEAVDLLGLVDSPCPRTLPPLPAPTLDVLDKAGLFSGIDGKSTVSVVTRKHFLASVRALEHYTPEAIPASAPLAKVVAVWARDSVLEGVVDQARRDAVMTGDEIAGEARDWLLGKRKDFGAAGWDKLTRRGVTARCIPGNHFSIMSPPLINDVQSALTDALFQLGHH